MPTLHWIGKEKVINHHLDIPYHTLNKEYTYDNGVQEPAGISENKIIHADNLLALKSLLPEYEGRVNCIYIDPPYNTGNESWVYNDNVSDPRFKKWLGKVVGKEAEDLTRHDKWLCMMYPRLKLLHKLLSEDGIIFISIDDIEVTFLKLVCDEIFGKANFLCQLIWKSRQNKDNRNISRISIDHEYVLCYGQQLRGVERDKTQFSNPDNDSRGDWVSANMVGLADKKARPNLHYNLINPETKIDYGCPKMGWRYDKTTMNKLIDEKRILWPKEISGRPRKKQFINDYKEDVTGFSSIIGNEIFTRDGTNILKEVFIEKVFDFPKPVEMIEALLEQSTNEDSIILDSFAGSGTTAHSVLNLNLKDGGNRKFILIEMEDYAETITAERVKRVVQGYGETEGIGGSFNFYTLGERVLDDEQNLNPNLSVEKIHSYIWYSEIHQPYTLKANAAGYLGKYSNTGYYFYYQPNEVTTLDDTYLMNVTELCEQYVMYADVCLLSERTMLKHNIIFKKIPRDISKL